MTRGHILILTYWSFKDPLIQTYTLPYVRMIRRHAGSKRNIHLITFESDTLSPSEKTKIKADLANEGIHWTSYKYSRSRLLAAINVFYALTNLLIKILTGKIQTIHCWCTPAGTLGYILTRMTGSQLIVDSFEPHAEAMVECGLWKKDGMIFKLLFYFEKKQAQKAEHLIYCTSEMSQYVRSKFGIERNDFLVRPACVDQQTFHPDSDRRQNIRNQLGLNNEIVCLVSGKLGGFYMKEEVFDFLAECAIHWNGNFKALLLGTIDKNIINSFCRKNSLPFNLIIATKAPFEQMPAYLNAADFAFSHNLPVPSKRYGTPIKNGEFWASGLPVVIPKNISDDSDQIQAFNAGYVLERLDRAEFRKAIEQLDQLLSANNINITRNAALRLAEKFRNLTDADKVYEKLYFAD